MHAAVDGSKIIIYIYIKPKLSPAFNFFFTNDTPGPILGDLNSAGSGPEFLAGASIEEGCTWLQMFEERPLIALELFPFRFPGQPEKKLNLLRHFGVGIFDLGFLSGVISGRNIFQATNSGHSETNI